jgi:hypothetical protein
MELSGGRLRYGYGPLPPLDIQTAEPLKIQCKGTNVFVNMRYESRHANLSGAIVNLGKRLGANEVEGDISLGSRSSESVAAASCRFSGQAKIYICI